MAGDIEVAVVSGTISSSATGTADFTKSGFGTPKACIVLLSFDPTDNTSVQAEGKASIGFSDFTNHRCISHQDKDGSAKGDSDARKSPTRAYVILTVSGGVDIDGTASTITDGVRLTNTTNGSASTVFATVIMFGGADLQVSLDSVSLGVNQDETTVVTTGIPQDLVFFIATEIAAEDNSSTGIENSFGVVDISNDQATIVNRCMGWASDHNNTVGSPSAVIRNDRCLKLLREPGGDNWGVEVTAATTTSYTVTTRDDDPGAGMEVYALALDLDDRGSKVGSVDSPTSGATWAPSVSLGFTPQYVGLGLTHAAVEGTTETDADAGGLGISSNTGSGEETCHSFYNEDAAPTLNTNNLFRSRVIDFRDDDVTTVIQDHSHSSFDSGGWTYTINTENETTAKKWFYWAIEEVSVASTTLVGSLFTLAPTYPTGEVQLFNTILDGVLFTLSPTFLTGNIQGDVILDGVLFTLSPTFLTGQVNLVLPGTTFTLSPTFPAGQINLAIPGNLFTLTPTFPTGNVQVDIVLDGVLFTLTPVFPVGIVNVEQTLNGVTFTLSPTYPPGQINLESTLTGTLFTLSPTYLTGQVNLENVLVGVIFQPELLFPTGNVDSGAGVSIRTLFIQDPGVW